NVSLAKIFPLGGKRQVIDACIEHQSPDSRRKLFVVDADFACLGCYSHPRYLNLLVLPRYCVENFLVDADAFLTLLYEEDPGRDVDELESVFNYAAWKAGNLAALARL